MHRIARIALFVLLGTLSLIAVAVVAWAAISATGLWAIQSPWEWLVKSLAIPPK